MIVNNLKDSVYILAEESEVGYTGYVITPLTSDNCLMVDKSVVGDLVEGAATVKLPDGRYKLEVFGTTTPENASTFSVYYNRLPYIIDKIQDLICPCTECKNIDSDKNLLEAFFLVTGFMQQVGLTCGRSGYTIALEKYYKILSESAEYEKYYGTFVFSYSKAVQDILAYTFVDLYLELICALKTGQDALEELNSLLKVDIMEKCFYRAGYNFQDIIRNIEGGKCNCTQEDGGSTPPNPIPDDDNN